MGDVLEMIYEYRMLVAKADQLAIPLEEAEAARLVALSKLLQGQAPAEDARRQMPRWPFPATVELTVAGGFAEAKVGNLSGGGLAVEMASTSPLGPRTIVRVTDPQDGLEYLFPCRVAWRKVRGASVNVGLAFDGVPSSVTFGSVRKAWGAGLRFGRARTTPITA
jgi:PilZ domain